MHGKTAICAPRIIFGDKRRRRSLDLETEYKAKPEYSLPNRASILYERLKILAKRIIVNPDGLIVDQELHSPLPYLRNLAGSSAGSHRDSEQVRLGAHKEADGYSPSAFRFKKAGDPR